MGRYPHKRVGADLFEHEEQQYLVLSDYYSNYFEMTKLSKITASNVVRACKEHFARHGIPDVLVGDAGTQFTSEEFLQFSKSWNFCHKMSSPQHH